MRNAYFKLFLFIFSLSNALGLWAQDTILVFHPTVDNIKTIVALSNGIMFPENTGSFHYLGVYHTSEQYEYEQSVHYLEKHSEIERFFTLKGIHGAQDPQQLYQPNNFSGELKNLFESSIGSIFTGGPDLPPVTYGEPMHLLTEVTDPERHYFELTALFHFMGSSRNPDFRPLMADNPDYVILGICLGMQTINVATGGTLIQDIPMEVYGFNSRDEMLENQSICHRNYNFDDPTDEIQLTGYHFHPIIITKKTTFSKNLNLNSNSRPLVLSSHHQTIELLGKGLKAVAWSGDKKIIEAIEHEKYKNVTGVQFHPEKTNLYFESTDMYVTADSTINFNAYILENASDKFHQDFWKMIGMNFLKSRTR